MILALLTNWFTSVYISTCCLPHCNAIPAKDVLVPCANTVCGQGLFEFGIPPTMRTNFPWCRITYRIHGNVHMRIFPTHLATVQLPFPEDFESQCKGLTADVRIVSAMFLQKRGFRYAEPEDVTERLLQLWPPETRSLHIHTDMYSTFMVVVVVCLIYVSVSLSFSVLIVVRITLLICRCR